MSFDFARVLCFFFFQLSLDKYKWSFEQSACFVRMISEVSVCLFCTPGALIPCLDPVILFRTQTCRKVQFYFNSFSECPLIRQLHLNMSSYFIRKLFI